MCAQDTNRKKCNQKEQKGSFKFEMFALKIKKRKNCIQKNKKINTDWGPLREIDDWLIVDAMKNKINERKVDGCFISGFLAKKTTKNELLSIFVRISLFTGFFFFGHRKIVDSIIDLHLKTTANVLIEWHIIVVHLPNCKNLWKKSCGNPANQKSRRAGRIEKLQKLKMASSALTFNVTSEAVDLKMKYVFKNQSLARCDNWRKS